MKTLPISILIIIAAILATRLPDGIGKILIGIGVILYGIGTIVNARKEHK